MQIGTFIHNFVYIPTLHRKKLPVFSTQYLTMAVKKKATVQKEKKIFILDTSVILHDHRAGGTRQLQKGK